MVFRTQPALDDLSSPFGPAKAAPGVQKSKKAKELCSRDQMIIVRLPRGGLMAVLRRGRVG